MADDDETYGVSQGFDQRLSEDVRDEVVREPPSP